MKKQLKLILCENIIFVKKEKLQSGGYNSPLSYCSDELESWNVKYTKWPCVYVYTMWAVVVYLRQGLRFSNHIQQVMLTGASRGSPGIGSGLLPVEAQARWTWRADPETAGGITDLIWPGNTPGSLRKSDVAAEKADPDKRLKINVWWDNDDKYSSKERW